jgi:hypothetical protein
MISEAEMKPDPDFKPNVPAVPQLSGVDRDTIKDLLALLQSFQKQQCGAINCSASLHVRWLADRIDRLARHATEFLDGKLSDEAFALVRSFRASELGDQINELVERHGRLQAERDAL